MAISILLESIRGLSIMRQNKPKIRFSSQLICEKAKKGESGRPLFEAPFTTMFSWAYPSQHVWCVVFTVLDMSEKTYSFHISIKPKYGKTLETLSTVDVPGEKEYGHTIIAQVNYAFEKNGEHVITISAVDQNVSTKIPLYNVLKSWPTFNKKEQNYLRKHQNLPNVFQVKVVCDKCGHNYLLEESVLDDYQPKGGIKMFPESGFMECDNCGYSIPLRDIQGRMRNAIKDSLLKAMK